MTSKSHVSAVRDPAIAGYAHAFVQTRPWVACVGDDRLTDGRGRVRRFASEAAAIAAGAREVTRRCRPLAPSRLPGRPPKAATANGFCPLSVPFGNNTQKCACHGVATRSR